MNYLILIIIMLICIYFIIFDNFRNINSENNILNKQELIDILINDYDNYYKTFNSTDLKIRNCKSIEEYKDKIKNSPITISNNEKTIIINTLQQIKIIFNKYNNIGFNGKKASTMNFKIGIIDGKDYEEGFPHTRGTTIIIPKYLISRNDLLTVLIHELVHVYQKTYSEDIQIYLDTYKFKKYINRNKQTRANPDIDDYIYSNSNNELLYCTYNEYANSIMDVTYYPYNIEASEHPFEMMAYNIELDIKNNIDKFLK